MVRANSLMRSTAAAYSSRSPGLRRDRKTVISIVLIPFLESIDRRATKFMETRLAACHGCATACSGQLEFRLAITRANLNVIFGGIFLPRQFLCRPMFGIGLPGALCLGMRKFDDGDSLAVVGVKVLVRNIARYCPRQFVHAIGERDIFVTQAGLQPRAEYGHDHGSLLYQLCFSYLRTPVMSVTHDCADRHQNWRRGVSWSPGAKCRPAACRRAARLHLAWSNRSASRRCRRTPARAGGRSRPWSLHRSPACR